MFLTVFQAGSTLHQHGRAGYRQLSDPQSKRPGLHGPHASRPGPEVLLAAHVPVNPTNQRTHRTEGWAHTCRATLHGRTGHRGLKSVTEELGSSELSTGGSASLFTVKQPIRGTAGFCTPNDLCVARPHTELPPLVQVMNTRLLSANLDSDCRLQHVSCCVPDECPDS